MNYCIVLPRITDIYEQNNQLPIGMAYVSSSLKQTGRNVIPYNLTYTTPVASEIIATLKRFPSIKKIFFVGDLFNPDFPNRI